MSLNIFNLKQYAPQIRFFIVWSIICFSSLSVFSQQKKQYIILAVPNTKAVSDHIGRYPILGNEADSHEFVIDYADDFKDIKTNFKVVGMLGANGNEYRLSKLNVSSNIISFQTETIDNVRFEFEGVFLKKGNLTRFYRKTTPVLKGTLTKYINGVKDSAVTFTCRYRALKAPYYLP